jgi:hypothetical protein
MDRDMCPY